MRRLDLEECPARLARREPWQFRGGLSFVEQARREAAEYFRQLVECAPDALLVSDATGRITEVNRQSCAMLGYTREELLTLTLADVAEARFAARLVALWASLEPGQAIAVDGAQRGRGGATFPVEARVCAVESAGRRRLVALVRDATERMRAEADLRQAQKLESVGRLAAGIAHELNTPIQFVGDNVHFVKDTFAALNPLLGEYGRLRQAAAGRVPAELLAEVARAEAEADLEYVREEIPRALAQTLGGIERVATIVRAMKDFAHPEGKEKTFTDLNAGLRSTLTVAHNELKYVAAVETALRELPPVLCRPGDLNQVFLNLLVNAAHAIADKPGGDRERGVIRVGTARAGDSVLVTIADTGCGIPEQIRPHIFDPFFTTKEVGRGTGQGLALARAIVVDGHGGSLTFESEVGRGTTFCIRLPITGGEGTGESEG